jgi:hypothetical protein
MKEEMNNQKTEVNRSRWKLPFGFFAGPILWGLEILVGYGLATVACMNGTKWPVYLTAGIAALIVLVAGVVAYQAWTSRTDESIFVKTDQAQDTPMFWAVSGFVVSTLFFLLILTTAVAAFFLSPCPIITMPLP